MTNQEAINYLLDPLSLPHDMDIMDKLNWHEDAVNMAIEALKAQELKNVPDTNVGGMINRQAAIDAINTWDKFGVDERGRIVRWYEGLEPYVHLRDVVTAIVNLPSAQPERCEDCETFSKTRLLIPQPEIIRCKNCKYQEKYFHEDRRRKDGGYYTYGCELAEGYSRVCLDDDFCSRAERRTDD